MDAIGTVCGAMKVVFEVYTKVKELRKVHEDAPEQLEDLENSCCRIELFLRNLAHSIPDTCHDTEIESEAVLVERLKRTAKRCMEDVEGFLDKVLSSSGDAEGGYALSRLKWVWNRHDYEAILKKLKDLEDDLHRMLTLEAV